MILPVTAEELAMLLGFKDIQIFILEKRLADQQKRIAELEKDVKAAA